MVERTESSGLDEFKGTVTKVASEAGMEGRTQYHISIDAEGIDIKGPTGLMHEWIPMSPKATEKSVPQGSVMDKYLTQIEICISEAKSAATIADAFALLEGKKFRFKKLKLGQAFEGNPAKEYIVPVALLE